MLFSYFLSALKIKCNLNIYAWRKNVAYVWSQTKCSLRFMSWLAAEEHADVWANKYRTETVVLITCQYCVLRKTCRKSKMQRNYVSNSKPLPTKPMMTLDCWGHFVTFPKHREKQNKTRNADDCDVFVRAGLAEVGVLSSSRVWVDQSMPCVSGPEYAVCEWIRVCRVWVDQS